MEKPEFESNQYLQASAPERSRQRTSFFFGFLFILMERPVLWQCHFLMTVFTVFHVLADACKLFCRPFLKDTFKLQDPLDVL